MTEISNILTYSMNDNAIIDIFSNYIKHHRILQNKTQSQLAEEAGVNRSTIVEFEKGKRCNMITFVQLLRALNLLHILENFKITREISPMLLAEQEQKYRKRASKQNKTTTKAKSDW